MKCTFLFLCYIIYPGLILDILCNNVHVVSESGSKIPNMTLKRLGLRVEIALELNSEWTKHSGWHVSESVKFEIRQLKSKVDATVIIFYINIRICFN